MPLYEYTATSQATHCEICQSGFEVLQKISEAPLTQCPNCGSPVEKQISRVAITRENKKPSLSKQNLEKNGFIRYEKSKTGEYVKTAGKEGPDVLKKPKSA
jgi:putative FmdB family regulatory protein